MLGSLRRLTALRFCSSMGAGPESASSTGVVYSKNNLSKLRKRTGYTILNCKKALEINGNDFKKALEWLNEQALKEGWAKASKLQGRKTSQGLIGIQVEDNVAAMVEVNCETDFVSRNQEFHNLVQAVTTACRAHVKHTLAGDEMVSKAFLTTDNLASFPWTEQNDKTVSDLVALKIGLLRENMTLKRAVGMRVTEPLQIGHYVHPTGLAGPSDGTANVAGKYGSIIAFKALPTPSVPTDGSSKHDGGGGDEGSSSGGDESSPVPPNKRLSAAECARQLCQHIVGMNPLTIGEKREETFADDIDDETQMIHQEFLCDTTMTVNDFLEQNGIQIVDFIRYECGETEDEPA